MAESGFKENEIKCTCGDSFSTMNDYFAHVSSVHGVEV